ncbi:hypothetical protein [Pseudomonas sp. PE-S1G-1]|uniref:hypothetical protein n=1 Tax=Pseudomonas sp. PE-S1G-1 TaxID=1986995 RepID=UPI000B3F927F|nr:hypothetical protein [Pseudomonas sp. PE-S1G-1]
MSLETTIAALVTAANNLTAAVNGKISAINATMATALAQFDEWRNQKDLEGDVNGFGTIRRNIFQGFVQSTQKNANTGLVPGSAGDLPTIDLGSQEKVYLHLKTPLNINKHTEMFWFNIKGYNYGGAAIVEETIVGYCYAPSRGLLNKSAFGSFSPDSYVDSSGNVILRMLFPSIYFTTLRIDTMKVGNGRLFNVKDLVARFSLSSTVEF